MKSETEESEEEEGGKGAKTGASVPKAATVIKDISKVVFQKLRLLAIAKNLVVVPVAAGGGGSDGGGLLLRVLLAVVLGGVGVIIAVAFTGSPLFASGLWPSSSSIPIFSLPIHCIILQI